jgi:hypothetical protein
VPRPAGPRPSDVFDFGGLGCPGRPRNQPGPDRATSSILGVWAAPGGPEAIRTPTERHLRFWGSGRPRRPTPAGPRPSGVSILRVWATPGGPGQPGPDQGSSSIFEVRAPQSMMSLGRGPAGLARPVPPRLPKLKTSLGRGRAGLSRPGPPRPPNRRCRLVGVRLASGPPGAAQTPKFEDVVRSGSGWLLGRPGPPRSPKWKVSFGRGPAGLGRQRPSGAQD